MHILHCSQYFKQEILNRKANNLFWVTKRTVLRCRILNVHLGKQIIYIWIFNSDVTFYQQQTALHIWMSNVVLISPHTDPWSVFASAQGLGCFRRKSHLMRICKLNVPLVLQRWEEGLGLVSIAAESLNFTYSFRYKQTSGVALLLGNLTSVQHLSTIAAYFNGHQD